MTKFKFLITTKNRQKDLVFTLNEMSDILNRCDVDCTIIDDGSTDNTYNIVKEKFPLLDIQRNEISNGYIYCRNKMLNETDAEFAISLDDDAHFISKNSLELIEKHFNNNPSCGLIAFRIFWSLEETNCITTNDTTHQVKSFVGCGHAWLTKAWKSIPNYPEWYEFYGEESFASMQLFKKKWKVDYNPEILIQHRVDLKNRAKQKKDFSFRYRRSLRAGWYNIFLFYPKKKITYYFAYSILMQFKKIVKGNFKVIKPFFFAFLDLIKSFPTILKNRNKFTEEEFDSYKKLSEPKIYWKPQK